MIGCGAGEGDRGCGEPQGVAPRIIWVRACRGPWGRAPRVCLPRALRLRVLVWVGVGMSVGVGGYGGCRWSVVGGGWGRWRVVGGWVTCTRCSQACLAGGSSTALVYNLWHRHPSGHGPLIDYDIVLVMGPSMLIGSLAGSAMHAALPTWFILALLVVVLGSPLGACGGRSALGSFY